MNKMMDEICAYLRNWFSDQKDRHSTTYAVINGNIALPFLLDGQYFRVIGSRFNDGVHCCGDKSDELRDEEFEGAIWAMSPPPALISLAEEIEKWTAENAAALASPYQSESFGGYSYTKAAGPGGALSWQDVFAARLERWRKI